MQEGRELVMLDKNKPVQTRDGRQVRNVCWDYRTLTGIRIAGIIVEHGGLDHYCTWKEDGRYYGDNISNSDLINVPEKIEGWNVYWKDARGSIYVDFYKDEPDLSKSYVGTNIVSCLSVTITVGEGL